MLRPYPRFVLWRMTSTGWFASSIGVASVLPSSITSTSAGGCGLSSGTACPLRQTLSPCATQLIAEITLATCCSSL